MTAGNALLEAIHQRLSGNPALMAMLGADGIHDRLLAKPRLPSIVFGPMDTRDYSTVTEAGEEHFLTLQIWSDAEGRRQGQEIAGRVRGLLHDAALPLDAAMLVSLAAVSLTMRREPKTRYYVGEMRLRAVTE